MQSNNISSKISVSINTTQNFAIQECSDTDQISISEKKIMQNHHITFDIMALGHPSILQAKHL